MVRGLSLHPEGTSHVTFAYFRSRVVKECTLARIYSSRCAIKSVCNDCNSYGPFRWAASLGKMYHFKLGISFELSDVTIVGVVAAMATETAIPSGVCSSLVRTAIR